MNFDVEVERTKKITPFFHISAEKTEIEHFFEALPGQIRALATIKF